MKHNRTNSPNWYALRWEILRRDDFTCRYCGQSAPDVILHVDHIISDYDGGTEEMANLITACSACNLGKNASRLKIIRYEGEQKPNLGARKTTALEDTMIFLESNPPSSATEIAKATGHHRATIAVLFRKTALFAKHSRRKQSVLYRLRI